jgi:isoquinoline 1-oxidoreductase beta subunit
VNAIVVPRRAFLASLGLGAGALVLGVVPTVLAAEAPPPSLPTFAQLGGDGGLMPNAFVHLSAQGKVTLVCSRSEMGQGVRSSLPALIADEMGADPAHVAIVQADGDAAYGNQDTDGSSSVRGGMYDDMRRMGATARVMLIAAAAKRWHVPVAECEAHDSTVVHAKSKRSIAFGDLALEAAKLPVPKAADVVLKPKSALKRVGGPLPQLDAPDVVVGAAVFGADVKLPGMLYAVVARPPVVGGTVAKLDSSRALAVAGVKYVIPIAPPKLPYKFQPKGGVAVVADSTWAAMRGRAALDITWNDGPNGSYDSTAYREQLLSAVRAAGKRARDVGDVDAALASSSRRVVAEYTVPHLAHAPMEPPCSTARIGADGVVEVWSPTQSPQDVRNEVAEQLGVDKAKVHVHNTLLGGAFGRKAKPDYDREAAFLARETKAPVRVQWTREDDIQHGYFHTTSAQRLEAGLDARGKVTGWLHRTAFPSISSTFANGVDHASDGELGQGVLDWPLDVPNVRAENGAAPAHVRIGWLRSVCNIHHAFALGSFMDEIAHARGVDPKDNLLDLLGPPRPITAEALGVKKVPNYGATLADHPVDVARFRHVVDRIATLSRWETRAKEGRSLGLAAHYSFLTYVAVVVSVVKGAHGVRVDEAWIVADVGTVVNPDRVKAMMEGAVVFGMSLAFHGAITMKKGAVEQTNFRDYRLVRMPEAPRAIRVDLIASDAPPGGAGEPGLPPVAPAIANAVFALTGRRVRDLPMGRGGVV